MKRSLLTAFLITMIIFGFSHLLLVRSSVINDSWPTWRHDPENTGFNEGMAPTTNQTAWTKNVGSGGGTTRGGGAFPAAVGYGKLFVGTGDGVLYAVDELNGGIAWTQTVKEGWALFSPALANNRVYVVSDAGELVALDEKTGEIMWRRNIPAAPSINVANDKLFIAAFNGSFYCFNATSSETLWTRDLANFNVGNYIITHPAVADGCVFLGLVTLNETDGSTLWNITLNEQQGIVGGNNFPAVVNGQVFIGIGDTMYCLDELAGTVSWTRHIGGDVTLTPPAVAYSKVFVTSSADGNLYCLNAQTGEIVWKQSVGSGTIERLASTPVIADNKVYVNLNNAVWGIMCLNMNNGAVLWSYVTAGPAAQALLSSGTVIVTLEHDPQIYSFGQMTTSDQVFWYYLGGTIIIAIILIGLFLVWRQKSKPKKTTKSQRSEK